MDSVEYRLNQLYVELKFNLVEVEEHMCDVQHSIDGLLGVRRVLAAVGHVFIQRHLPADRRIFQLQKHTDDTDTDEEDEAAARREHAVRDTG